MVELDVVWLQPEVVPERSPVAMFDALLQLAAIGETVILLHPPLSHPAGVSIETTGGVHAI